MAGKGDSVRTIFYALGANFAIFVTKAFAAWTTGSSAMLAEAVHSLADCGNQGLLLLGIKRAKRSPSPDYPLGYGKEIYFWSFLVALMLFCVGGMFSLYEGWHKLHATAPLTKPWLAVGVLTFGIIAESISMRACLVEVNKSRGSLGLWRWFRESRQAELVVIFGEDLAALLGLVFALVAVVLTMITGNPLYDALGTLGIGVLLIVVAVFVAVEIKAMLIGQSVEVQTRDAIRQFIEQRPEIGEIFNVITLQLGNDIMVAVQAAPADPSMSTAANIVRINAVEAALRARFTDVKWCFFEMDDSD
ncbi:MAG: cation diffusion facilitator family transporter [Arenimonas sp.]